MTVLRMSQAWLIVTVALCAAPGCGDGIGTMQQTVQFRVVDRATSQPVLNAEGTWSRWKQSPIQFNPTDAAGLTQVITMTNVIYGVTFLPFSATHAEFQLEAKDYASGSPVKIVVKDHDGEDICQGNIAKGSMISGDRHVIEFVKIGRAKRNGTIMSGECRDEAAPIESARLSGS